MELDYLRENPEAVLYCLPPTRPPRKTPRLRLQPLELPLAFSGPVALLEGGFELDRRGRDRNVREFSGSEIAPILAFAPEAIVAPLDVALSLADQHTRGLLELPSLRSALVVLTRVDDTPLGDHHRDLLWRAFQVPIFEQLRGWDGAVIARECEVHDGLHVVETTAVAHIYDEELVVTMLTAAEEPVVRARTGLTGEIEREPCDCGLESPRLRRLAPAPRGVTAAAGRR